MPEKMALIYNPCAGRAKPSETNTQITAITEAMQAANLPVITISFLDLLQNRHNNSALQDICKVAVLGGDGTLLSVCAHLHGLCLGRDMHIMSLGGGSENRIARHAGTLKTRVPGIIKSLKSIGNSEVYITELLRPMPITWKGDDKPQRQAMFWGASCGNFTARILKEIERLRKKGTRNIQMRRLRALLATLEAYTPYPAQKDDYTLVEIDGSLNEPVVGFDVVALNPQFPFWSILNFAHEITPEQLALVSIGMPGKTRYEFTLGLLIAYIKLMMGKQLQDTDVIRISPVPRGATITMTGKHRTLDAEPVCHNGQPLQPFTILPTTNASSGLHLVRAKERPDTKKS